MQNSLYGKLRSNVRVLNAAENGSVGHFSVTLKSQEKNQEVVENIFLTDRIWEFAKKHLKKGVIAVIYFEYREHSWFDANTQEQKTELKKFATFIKPKMKQLVQ